MKAQIMKRAWEIFRTMVGERLAKLSAALKQAWAEFKNGVKKMAKQLKGSEKQIAWAEDIRKAISERNFEEDMWVEMGFYGKSEEEKAKASDAHKYLVSICKAAADKMIRTEESASHYIDIRNDITRSITEYAFDSITSETTEGASDFFAQKFNRSIEKGYSKKIVSVDGVKYIFSVKNSFISIDSKDSSKNGRFLDRPSYEERVAALKAIAEAVR